ncbi:hypothetical protein F5I97DRAFT_2044303 [Phlebopus sp. FC_14]|nr:hypothetical protein F5I97DRAFT_2044303 [Phlebopus sp. FC_14]
MRVKRICTVAPIPAKLRLLVSAAALSSLVIQVQAFRINAQAADFLASVTDQGNAVDSDAFYVQGNDLRLCDNVPKSFSTSSCQVIWDGSSVGNNTLAAASSSRNAVAMTHIPTTYTAVQSTSMSTAPHCATTSEISQLNDKTHSTSALSLIPTVYTLFKIGNTSRSLDKPRVVKEFFQARLLCPRDSPGSLQAVETNGTIQVIINGMGWDNVDAILDKQCLWALGWPLQTLRQTKREDITFIAFQIWVLGMSAVALLNESVPHTIASLLTHMVATGWAGFQIFNTAQFRSEFARVTTNGACHPINLLPSYWQSRAAAEIPSLVLNAVALLVSTFLSWRLAKIFGWQTFKRVGASLTISRIYKTVLTLSIVIQLSLFFVVTSVALWLDQLWNGAIGHLATSPIYKPLLIFTLTLLFPWLALGWFAVRRELKVSMLIFLVMCLGYLGGWGAMFDSTTFRWTYMTWTFFGVITSASVFLSFLSFVLGIICRVNFGKGLARYLNAQTPLPGHGLEPVNHASDLEKVALPSIPTFSIAFRSQLEAPPSFVPLGDRQLSARPIGTASQRTLQRPSPVLTRPLSSHTCSSLEGHKSFSSVRSFTSMSSPASNTVDVKRWIIE